MGSSAVMVDFPEERIDQRGHDMLLPVPEGENRVVVAYEIGSSSNVSRFIVIDAASCSACGQYPAWEDAVGTPQEQEDKLLSLRTNYACREAAAVPITFALAVPSGSIVFSDSLWREAPQLAEVDDSDFASYNSLKGQRQYSAACAALGIAYGPVLNTSPHIYLDTETSSLIVASPALDEQDEYILPATWRELGQVTTDLWAYSIMDGAAYRAAGGVVNEFIAEAEVPAGVYSFTHYASLPGFDHHSQEETIFATAAWAPLT